MDKHKQLAKDDSALDDDVIEKLAEAHEPIEIAPDMVTRMRGNIMTRIKKESNKKINSNFQEVKSSSFSTIHTDDGEWIEAMPGGKFKVLHDDGNGFKGLMSYLIRLDAGFELDGHNHPFDEECLMLEGDLTMGDITLNKGDFHYAPAGVPHGRLSTQNGCLAFIRGALPV
jgi:quercetin dioxygenase-like cupin family protein